MPGRFRRHNNSGRQYVPQAMHDIGALEQRVYNIEKGQTALGERIDALAQGLDGRIDRLTAAMERRAQPQWQAFSVVLTFVGMVGAIVYLLIQSQIGYNTARTRELAEAQLRLVELVRDGYVPRGELAVWQDNNVGRIDRMGERMEGLVARPEYSERFRTSDVQIAGVEQRLGNLEQAFGSTYSIGDVLRGIQERMLRLEDAARGDDFKPR